MNARIMVHPKVAKSDSELNMLSAFLSAQGYNVYTEIVVYHPQTTRKSNVHELVRQKGMTAVGMLLERMDGVQFVHVPPPMTPPQAA